MFDFHGDRRRYFDMQIQNTHDYVIPFIEAQYPITPNMRVLEIGCGEGGVLKAFINKGCTGIGVELDNSRIEHGKQWLQKDIESGKIKLISKDIYDVDAGNEFNGGFDIIVLKDVIEHIHDQKKLIIRMKFFLNINGAIFFGFPPWQMPYGGHQQMCRGKLLSKLPYYHLLPTPLYKWILKVNGEHWPAFIEMKETGISVEKFEGIVKKSGYKILKRTFFLINPIYQYKFGLKPKTQFSFISRIPIIRNFFTTCVYYLIQAHK